MVNDPNFAYSATIGTRGLQILEFLHQMTRAAGTITQLTPKSGANFRFPPGEAIRGSSRSLTALDPEPTAQTDPKQS
jgi:hypothetical protein